MEDFSSLTPEQKALRETVAKDKGDRIAILSDQLKELERDFPIRLAERERLEKEIEKVNQDITQIKAEKAILNRRLTESQCELAEFTKKINALRQEEQTLTASIQDLKEKIEKRNILAQEVKDLLEEEKDLKESLRLKDMEFRAYQVKINPIKEKEADIIRREALVTQQEAQNAADLTQIDKQHAEVRKMHAEIEERKRYIDLSGKTMGYYIRGVQKKFDELGIKIDFIKLLDEIK